MGCFGMHAPRHAPAGRRHALAWGMCGVLLLAAAGCGRSTGPTVQFVKGMIKLDGQPLEGATVALTPAAGSTGLPAYGITDPGGMFVVTSARGGKVGGGAVAGDYIVTVKKMRTVTEADIGILITRRDYEKQKLDNKDNDGFQPVIPVVPAAYGVAETSGMRVTVKKGRNTGPGFEFDLSPDFKGR
ncbi:MAG: hypothetical protein ACKO6B_09935 [Planctomycetia bacterium]